MNYALRVVCRPELAAGFGLAGIRPTVAATTEAGVDALRDLSGQADVGVVLVQDVFYEAIPDDVRRRIAKRALPLVVPFPGPVWIERAGAAETYIVELLRQVIGYRVRLR